MTPKETIVPLPATVLIIPVTIPAATSSDPLSISVKSKIAKLSGRQLAYHIRLSKYYSLLSEFTGLAIAARMA